jgi:YesN/AraC family two-component response regulator
MNTISNIAISIQHKKSNLWVNNFVDFDASFGCGVFWNEGLKTVQNGLPKNKLKLAIEYINQHLDGEITLLDISSHLGVSQYHFGRLFKKSMGVTAHTYLVQQRVKKAQQLLQETELKVQHHRYQV